MHLPWADVLAVDVGTATLHISVKDHGVVVREPSLVAFGDNDRRPVAFGVEARRMLERGVQGVRVVQPVRQGVVADFDATVLLLRHFMHRALGRRPMLNPVVVTARATAATPVEERALHDALRAAGAGRIVTVPKTLAAALGAGVPLDTVESHLVVDLGAGAADAGTVSMGLLSAGISPALAGDYLDRTLIRHFRRTQGVRVSWATAEEIKCQVGTVDAALVNGHLEEYSATGEDLQVFDLNLDEVPEVLSQALQLVYDELSWLVEQLPPKARAEISANGVILTGGTALLRGFADQMAETLGIPVQVATDPLSSTILGLQSLLNDLRALSIDSRRFSCTTANSFL
jgi:rod shape-determining protein MreB